MLKIFHRHLEKSKHSSMKIAIDHNIITEIEFLFCPSRSRSRSTPRAIISVRDCEKKKKIEKRARERKRKKEEVGAWLGDRSGQSLPLGLFLRRAILLCLNEVGDLTLPRDPPPPSYIAGNFVPSVLRSFNSASKTSPLLRRCTLYRLSVRFYLL